MIKQYIKFRIDHQRIVRTDAFYVVGGSRGYLFARFEFSEDWADEVAYAVFTINGRSYRQPIVDNECEVPWEVLNTNRFLVGCEAGDRITSDAVAVDVVPSGAPDADPGKAPTMTLQRQIGDISTLKTMARNLVDAVNEVAAQSGEIDPETIKEAVDDYLEQNPVGAPVQSVNGQTGKVELTADDVGAISQDDLQEATNEALSQAKASGEFDGKDGKDYVLTDADKTEIAELAAGLVEVLKTTMQPLTFTGAVEATYDGSEAVSVEIPSGGGGGEWELIGEIISDGAGDLTGITIPFDGSQYREIFVCAYNCPGKTNLRTVIRKDLIWSDASFFGYNGTGASTSAGGIMNNTWSMTGHAYNIGGKLFMYGAAESKYNGGSAKWRQGLQSGEISSANLSNCKYISVDTNNNGIVPEGVTLVAWGKK